RRASSAAADEYFGGDRGGAAEAGGARSERRGGDGCPIRTRSAAEATAESGRARPRRARGAPRYAAAMRADRGGAGGEDAVPVVRRSPGRCARGGGVGPPGRGRPPGVS